MSTPPPNELTLGAAPTGTADPRVLQALQAWQARLLAAGLACRGVACQADEPAWTVAFTDAALAETFATLVPRVSVDKPVALARREGGGASAELLMASRISLPDGRPGVVGVALAPPHHERLAPQVLLSLGGLQLALSAASLAHNQRAARLLELLGHVAAQDGARAAAQEWINRCAAWLRAEVPGVAGLGLSLFEVRGQSPHWWVAADTAWAETGSTAVQEAGEPAAQAAAEARGFSQPPWWAEPVLADGEVVAVLVARHDAPGGAALPDEAQLILRSALGAAAPLLRHWRRGDRSLPGHALDALRGGWRRLHGPGHLVWKAGAAAAVAAAVLLLALPVDDRITAPTVIEGRERQLVTAPFDGFIAAVAVRPGETVRAGQLLARLDDRELQLEQARQRSERDQAQAKLRQALAERDPPALALATAALRQAESQLALIDSKLARAVLVAPMDGLVVTGDWAQQLGSPVETGKEMFEVASADGWRVVLHVADADIARVRPGQQGVLRLAGQPQSAFGFELSRLSATASVQEGVNGFRVEAAWLGAAPPLSPGMQGVAKVTVGQANLLTVWTRSSIDWLRLKLWAWWL